jgi:hypothetical protein
VVKTEAEQNTERLTLGLVLLVIAFSMFDWLPNVDGLGALLLGLVLLGSAFYQYTRNWEVGTLTWIVGAAALALGLANLMRDLLQGAAFAIAVLLIGVWLVGRGFGMEL